jgi:phage virion morphogenesis protein
MRITLEGNLANNLHYQLTSSLYSASLEFGSNEVYAAIHQFGGTTSPFSMMPNQEIPARAFLGIADKDEQTVMDIINNYLAL